MEIRKGAVLKGRYRLDLVLGRGGMASVWRGHDDVLDRPVAVKLLSDVIATDPGFQARFRREATVAAGLSHPNLVRVYDYAQADERPYLVMEFVPGEDLGALIAREEPVDRDRLARQLLSALAHIHGAGIVHRDVKPQNVVIERDGNAKLIDFGIALPRDAAALTSTGLVLATRSYAAPEVMQGRVATERSDLYSCGRLLAACGGGGPAALDEVVEQLTEEEPGRRPVSARAALKELERGVEVAEPTAAFTPVFADADDGGRLDLGAPRDPTSPALVYSRKARNRRRWAVALGIGAAILAAAVVVVSSVGGGSDGGGSKAAQERSATVNGKDQRGAASSKGASAPSGEAADATEASEPVEEAPTPAAGPAPTGADSATGSTLNEQGYELIQAGRYDEAVPVLEESVRSFPAGTDDIDYAYALFNLGDALLRSGRPEEAIPILEQRLRIPNQTAVVQRELEAARAEAGAAPASESGDEGGLSAEG